MKKHLFGTIAALTTLTLAVLIACSNNNKSNEDDTPPIGNIVPPINVECPQEATKNENGECITPPLGNGECPEGTRKNESGECIAPPTSVQCPQGATKNENGECVSSPVETSSSSAVGVPGTSSSFDDSGTPTSSSSSSSPTLPPPSIKENFTETVGNASFDMVYIPGGTFTIGCEKSSGCPDNTDPVEGVKVSNYFIAKTEVTTGLWNAVMGGSACPQYQPNCGANSYTSMTWYDAMEFACKLSQMTNKNYRMTTEAEWEYAAKNHLSSLDKIGSGEEWAYNSWSGTHSGGTDPLGPGSGTHTQKTRRDAQGAGDNITARLIRSIEGVGPALRLAVSSETSFPPGYVAPCDLKAPEIGDEPVNSYRDMRWVTGSGARWTTGGTMGSFDLRVWEDGTASMGNSYGGGRTNGQWFTSNNIAFVFVPSSGSSRKYAYIFLDETQGSLISDQDFMSGGYVGRIIKESASNLDKPTISGGLKSGAELAAAAGDDYKMVDMVNIPESAKKQDSRLLDGTDNGWFQDNSGPGIGGVHHYRKDVDLDEFRFTVNQINQNNQNQMTMLANGKWFTVNNTFLRVTHSTGYTADYLYAITPDGTFQHNSFMAYERGDFRMFKKVSNSSYAFPATCGSHCNKEIPKGEGASMYAPGGYMANVGHSTFEPAPCPTGGCR